MMFVLVWPPHATLLYSVVYIFEEMLYRVVRNVVSCRTKCCIRLATPLLSTIKQHGAMCNKCCMMFYEMLYSFGRGFNITM